MSTTLAKSEDASQNFTDDFVKRSERVKQSAEHLINEVKNVTKETFNHTKETGQELYSDLKTKYGPQIQAVDSYVRENPVKSAAIGMAVGFILGKFLKTQ